MLRKWQQLKLTRRELLGGAIASAAALAAACGEDDNGGQAVSSGSPSPQASPPAATEPSPTTAQTQVLAPTPACGDADDVTPSQTEGPYFTTNSPERESLGEPGMAGEPLTVRGFALSTDCQPVVDALLDFWQADDAGEYDNVGYRLRGHQFTGDDGSYRLETIVPGLYPGRTRHIHVKVQAPGQPVLTTQLYFPDEPGNAQDSIFNEALVMNVQDTADGKSAEFNFVVEVG